MIKEFKVNKDKRGALIAVDHNDLPFTPMRDFCINRVPPTTIRGGHAHYDTRQFFLCTSGSIIVYLHNGERCWIVYLKAGQGVYIPPMTWGTEFFIKQSSATVYADRGYNRSDYITDWKVFLKECKK